MVFLMASKRPQWIYFCLFDIKTHGLLLIFLLLGQMQYAINSASTSSQSSFLLLYSTYNDIKVAQVSPSLGTYPNTTILINGLKEASAIDYDYVQQKICWTDPSRETIDCMTINNSSQVTEKRSIITSGLDKPEGLAIDWCADNIYWTDGETNRIEVAKLDGKHQKVLFWTDLDQPRAITLVPSRRYMIWTDWGEVPKIERASMDGDPMSRITLVKEDTFWPNSLTVDLEKEIIYWVDGKLQFLASMDFNGENRRQIVKDLQYPYSVTYSQNRLFWTDWQEGTIHSHDLLTGKTEKIIESPSAIPITVHVWDPRLQPAMDNPCKRNTTKCSHLCLLSTNSAGYSCACPTGVKLISETRCADGPQDMLFLVQRTQISKISLDSPDFTSFALPLPKVKYAIAIDYDPVQDYVYWSDEEVHAIRRARSDGTGVMDVVNTEIGHPDGLAIDWLARNLYWTDTGTDRIEVCSLEGTYRKVLINKDLSEPRAIALAPPLGWMFWSDWNEDKPKVERASLDGTERVVLVFQDLGWPNGIALDIDAKKIYWCDAKTDKIEVANMDGSERSVVLLDNLPHVFGLSLLGDYLYWTDWQRRSIDRAHKITGQDRIVVVEQFPDLMGLKVTRLHNISGTSPCAKNNGGCDQLCLNRPKDYVCRCHIDYELGKDKKTCYIPPAFLLFSKQDSIGRASIEFSNDDHNDFIPFKDVSDAHYLDVDIADRRIYWADQKTKCIYRAYINGSDVQQIVESGLLQPEGIAIDWLAHNIYWADADAKRIEVARLDGRSRRILIWKGIEEPRNLILEPPKGFMYWTEWPSSSIRRAYMDGTNVYTIIPGVVNATGLTLDPQSRRLYWASAIESVIEFADFDGKHRSRLVDADNDTPFKPHVLTFNEDYIYWNDWETGNIERIHVSGKNRAVVNRNLGRVTSLIAFNASRPTGGNQCRTNNGGCHHLCLALPGSRKMKCACPTHYSLDANNVSCIPPVNYLIYSHRNSFGRLMINSADSPIASLPVSAKNVRAVEYDPVFNNYYWIDGRGSIRRSNGTKASTFVGTGSQPFDLAIDVIGRLLFWTCSYANTINITSLENYGVGVVNIDDTVKPRSLAIHTTKRLLFWSDIGTQSIIAAKMDGSHRVTLATDLEGVYALAVDISSNLIYFSHGKRIDVMDIMGEHRKTFVSDHISQVVSIAAFQNNVYWIEDKPGIEIITSSRENRRTEMLKAQQISDIVAVWTPDAKLLKDHTCGMAKNKCSHICIASDSKSDEICGCPAGLKLMKDRYTCVEALACGAEYFTCATLYPKNGMNSDNNKDCIPISWRCDGQADCPDKSDELDCPSCRPDQFRCQSGECIEKSFECDGTTNCDDGFDEANCCKKPTDFRCSNNVCIPSSNLCDGWDNCAEGEDESPAQCLLTSNKKITPDKKTFIIIMIVVIIIMFFGVYVLQIFRSKMAGSPNDPREDQSAAPLSPGGPNKQVRVSKLASVADAIRMSSLNIRTSANSYDRNHITGASSSTTNGSSLIGYPLNPPPSPATTAGSARYNTYHPYKHYKIINQPPPPTPCSTDVCDESDSAYTSKSRRSYRGDGRSKYKNEIRYDSEPYPPPPTPRSHYYHSDVGILPESCPPSPSSRSSTYFSPLPPPPSPVPSRYS